MIVLNIGNLVMGSSDFVKSGVFEFALPVGSTVVSLLLTKVMLRLILLMARVLYSALYWASFKAGKDRGVPTDSLKLVILLKSNISLLPSSYMSC